MEPTGKNLTTGMSVEFAEEQAMKLIFTHIIEHVDYLSSIYKLAFSIQVSLDGQKFNDIPELTRAQFMIFMRITDFLRSIQLLCIKGYPEQAGTLAASVFELAHTAQYFENSPTKVTEWLCARTIEEHLPRGLLGKSWREVVQFNAKHLGDADAEVREYQVYTQLCWMKHSLPKMQDIRIVDKDTVELISGPYSDERSISHSWFAMEHAGRLTELVIALLLKKTGEATHCRDLTALSLSRDALRQKAIERFGSQNPFLNDKT